MSEETQRNKNRTTVRLDSTSRFWKTLLVILAVFLTFIGPTYIVYVLFKILKMDFAISMGSGFALFIAGLVLIWYLIKNKVIS